MNKAVKATRLHITLLDLRSRKKRGEALFQTVFQTFSKDIKSFMFSMDTKKSYGKIQPPFLIILSNLGTEGNFLNLIKSIS